MCIDREKTELRGEKPVFISQLQQFVKLVLAPTTLFEAEGMTRGEKEEYFGIIIDMALSEVLTEMRRNSAIPDGGKFKKWLGGR